jgi:hypothetical protein
MHDKLVVYSEDSFTFESYLYDTSSVIRLPVCLLYVIS